MLVSLGLEVTPEMIEGFMEEYDTDRGGDIGLTEFLQFLNDQNADARQQLELLPNSHITMPETDLIDISKFAALIEALGGGTCI